MKILHVIANLAPRYGGPPKACMETAGAVAALGHEVRIYTTTMDGDSELDVPLDRPVVNNGVEIHYFATSRPRFWCASWSLGRALDAATRDADVVHIHALYLYNEWAAARLCRRHGVPYVIQPHGALDPYLHRRYRWRKAMVEALFHNRVMGGAATVLYTTEEEKRLAEPHACGAPGAVVPLGLDGAEFDNMPAPGAFRAAHPEIGDKTILLFFGRLHVKKGLDILARAFGKLARMRDDIHLVIAGPDDGMRDKTVRWLRDEGVLEKTTLTGMLLGDDKRALLGDADIFVLPSFSENFGIAVVEAMARGLPVVISDRVNIWREVEAAGAGRVAPPEAAAFAGEIAALLDDSRHRHEMGAAGRRLAKDAFSSGRAAERLEALYETVAAGGRP